MNKKFVPVYKIVFTFIGVVCLLVFAYINLIAHPPRTYDERVKQNFLLLQNQLEHFRLDHGSYPDELEELIPNYILGIPVDSRGGKYALRVQGNKKILYLKSTMAKDSTHSIELFHDI